MRQLLSIYDIDVARAYISKGFVPIVTGNDGQSDLSRFAILRVSLNLQCQEQFRKKKTEVIPRDQFMGYCNCSSKMNW